MKKQTVVADETNGIASSASTENTTPTDASNLFEDSAVDDGAIAALAYELWQKRGCPDGCSEEDWFCAERELSSRRLNGTASRRRD